MICVDLWQVLHLAIFLEALLAAALFNASIGQAPSRCPAATSFASPPASALACAAGPARLPPVSAPLCPATPLGQNASGVITCVNRVRTRTSGRSEILLPGGERMAPPPHPVNFEIAIYKERLFGFDAGVAKRARRLVSTAVNTFLDVNVSWTKLSTVNQTLAVQHFWRIQSRA